MVATLTSLWNRLPFAGRLLFTASTALIIAGGAMLYTSARWEAQEVQADLRDQLQAELLSLPPSLAEILVIGDFSTLQQTLNSYVRRSNISKISYRDTSGTVVESRDLPVKTLAPDWFAAWFGIAEISGEAAAEIGGRRYGSLDVVISAQESVNRAWSRLIQHLSILLLAIILDFIGIWLVLRTGLKPLRVLNDASVAFGRGELSVRIEPVGAPEMQTTARAFNNMASRIENLLTSLQEREARLHAALAEQSTVLDNAIVGISFVKDRRIIWCNHRHEEMFGYSKDEIIDRLTEGLYASPSDFQRLGKDAYPAMQTLGNFSGEYRMKRKNGSQFWGLLSGKLVDRSDPRQGSIWILEDVTLRREAQESLKHLNETLEQRVREEVAKNREKDHLLIQQSRLAAMGEMIGNIAHQWRQPLNALGILLANIKDAYVYKELDEEYLNAATATGQSLLQKMSTTIDDFRNFFRPNREKVAFSINTAIREALCMVEASFHNHHIAVDWREGEDLMAHGFPSEYSQVLLNLLGNARDAILKQRPANGQVTIRAARVDDNVALSVADNGGGIPEDVLPKIFDPYFTTKIKGTGIGLYMSKMIIEGNMGGRIEACNGSGGAEFTVVTPLAPEPS